MRSGLAIFDARPTQNEHRYRGIGRYTAGLAREIARLDPSVVFLVHGDRPSAVDDIDAPRSLSRRPHALRYHLGWLADDGPRFDRGAPEGLAAVPRDGPRRNPRPAPGEDHPDGVRPHTAARREGVGRPQRRPAHGVSPNARQASPGRTTGCHILGRP